LKYVDPSGEFEECSVYDQPEDKPWYEDAWDSTVDFASEYGTKILNGSQLVLDVAGLVPGVGEIADGANALIYEARGDHVNAALSGAAMIPFAGWFSTGGKLVNKAVKYSDEAGSLIKATTKEVKQVEKVINKAPDFIVTPKGDVFPIPNGATGPMPVNNGKGFKYVDGSGGNGLNKATTDFRFMDPVTSGKYKYPNGYGSYNNAAGQTVNPLTGQTISPSNPWWHISW
jgi:hypothetical protein